MMTINAKRHKRNQRIDYSYTDIIHIFFGRPVSGVVMLKPHYVAVRHHP